jgi:hypothetical protein
MVVSLAVARYGVSSRVADRQGYQVDPGPSTAGADPGDLPRSGAGTGQV